jgi:hypothetical protein
MNEELLNLLREIADPAKCKLPEGWSVDRIGDERCFLKNRYVQGSIDSAYLDDDKIMDLLGRLMRAIEGKRQRVFTRLVLGGLFWKVSDREWDELAFCNFESNDAASEALALAKCIRAAVEKAVTG